MLKENYNSIIFLTRKSKKMTLVTLGEMCHVDPSFLSRMENGYIASDEMYDVVFKNLELDKNFINDELQKANEELLESLHKFCHLSFDELKVYEPKVISIDGILNHVITKLLNAFDNEVSMLTTLPVLDKEVIKDLELLEASYKTMNDYQKGAFNLFKMYKAILNRDEDEYYKCKDALQNASHNHYVDPFEKLLEGINYIYSNNYYLAIRTLISVKKLFTDELLYNWCILTDVLLAMSAVLIDDKKAVKLFLEVFAFQDIPSGFMSKIKTKAIKDLTEAIA